MLLREAIEHQEECVLYEHNTRSERICVREERGRKEIIQIDSSVSM